MAACYNSYCAAESSASAVLSVSEGSAALHHLSDRGAALPPLNHLAPFIKYRYLFITLPRLSCSDKIAEVGHEIMCCSSVRQKYNINIRSNMNSTLALQFIRYVIF